MGLLAAFRLPFEGARILASQRRLWLLALVPVMLSLLAFGTAISAVVAYAPELYAWATRWIPELTAEAWYAWVWIGPAKLLFFALGGIAFLAIAGACLVAAYMLASLLASPFHDALSFRAEEAVAGRVEDVTESGLSGTLREGLRAVRQELRRMGFFLAVVVPLAAIGFLVPGAQLLTGPAIATFTVFFLPLDYASYTLDRRRISFAEKRRWLMANKRAALGFGLAAFLTCLVPVLNFFAMPLLVIGGTLLVLRQPLVVAREVTPVRTDPGAGAGTPTSP